MDASLSTQGKLMLALMVSLLIGCATREQADAISDQAQQIEEKVDQILAAVEPADTTVAFTLELTEKLIAAQRELDMEKVMTQFMAASDTYEELATYLALQEAAGVFIMVGNTKVERLVTKNLCLPLKRLYVTETGWAAQRSVCQLLEGPPPSMCAFDYGNCLLEPGMVDTIGECEERYDECLARAAREP